MSSTVANSLPAWTPRSAGDRVLMLLKMHGDKSAADLGKSLGTSGEAARQQLARLAEEGYVESWSQARGVGRPAQFWRLTDKGQSRFPDTHAALTVDLLATISEELGADMLGKIIDAREAKTRAAYRAELETAPDLETRVARLADIRSREGYMADWERDEDDGFVLYENHCPICAAATACQNFCRAELAVFREVLGPNTQIERTEHIIAGARRCAYRITPT